MKKIVVENKKWKEIWAEVNNSLKANESVANNEFKNASAVVSYNYRTFDALLSKLKKRLEEE